MREQFIAERDHWLRQIQIYSAKVTEAERMVEHWDAILSVPLTAVDRDGWKKKTVPEHIRELFAEAGRPVTQSYLVEELMRRRGKSTTKAAVSIALKELRESGEIKQAKTPDGFKSRRMYGPVNLLHLEPLTAEDENADAEDEDIEVAERGMTESRRRIAAT